MRKNEVETYPFIPKVECYDNLLDLLEQFYGSPIDPEDTEEYGPEFFQEIQYWIGRIIYNEVLDKGLLLEQYDELTVPVDSYIDLFDIKLDKRLGDKKESLEKEINTMVRNKLIESKQITIEVINPVENNYQVMPNGLYLTSHDVSVYLYIG